MINTAIPFDDVKNLVHNMPAPNDEFGKKHDLRGQDLVEVKGYTGLATFSRHLSQFQMQHPPQCMRPEIVLFAGSHGVVRQNITPNTSADVTQKLQYLQEGVAPLNQICLQYGAGLKVFEVGVDLPTEDIFLEAAMTEKETVATIAYGMEAVASGGDILGLSSLGAGGCFVASVLSAALLGQTAKDWISYSECLSSDDYNHKLEVFQAVLDRHNDTKEPLEKLRRMGGREISALVGAIIAARYQNIPILLDSPSALVAALVLKNMRHDAIDHCLAAHCSRHYIHKKLLEALNMSPILELDMGVDGGIGIATAIGVLKTAVIIHNQTAHREKSKKA